jgi:hypothetical protein
MVFSVVAVADDCLVFSAPVGPCRHVADGVHGYSNSVSKSRRNSLTVKVSVVLMVPARRLAAVVTTRNAWANVGRSQPGTGVAVAVPGCSERNEKAPGPWRLDQFGSPAQSSSSAPVRVLTTGNPLRKASRCSPRTYVGRPHLSVDSANLDVT